jgi:uncharacterized protein with NAD-binding domain and iron-sulfur cluster
MIDGQDSVGPGEKPRRQVAILGAGPAGLAAAFALSRTAALRERYRVTVYQMGWRAGGKSATGRAMDKGWRIEQNGSHYLFGCYANCFAMLAEAYQVLAEKGETGFGTYRDQFVPRGLIVSREDRGGRWEDWFTFFPETPVWPERPGKYPPPSHFFFIAVQLGLAAVLGLFLNTETRRARAVEWLLTLFPLSPFHSGAWARRAHAVGAAVAWWIDVPVWSLARVIGRLFSALASLVRPPTRAAIGRWGLGALRTITQGSRWLARTLDRISGAATASGGLSRSLHRFFVTADLGATIAIGVIDDELWKAGGLERIDDEDFRDWLDRHAAHTPGAPPVRDCPLTKIWYDAVVAYEDGDGAKPRIAAGVTLHAIFRAVVTYKGAFAYQMTHEIGDAFVAPIVRALQLRGVDFRFFHRVRGLEANVGAGAEAPSIRRIILEQQIPEDRRQKHLLFATMEPSAEEAARGATPRQVWPNRPLFSDETAAGADGIPLDDHHAPDSFKRLKLERGRDFDDLVYTLPPGVSRELAGLKGLPVWTNMCDQVKSAATQSLRIWLRTDLAGLGWREPNPILSGFSYPYSTWEDNGQNLGAETFAAIEQPRSIATVFGPLASRGAGGQTLSEQEQRQLARTQAWSFFRDQVRGLWPGLPESIQDRYALLLAPEGTTGEARFEWQYQRANVGPIESYILALPGTLVHRLRPDESGFSNMYLAGEWTRNGFEVGCVEGAVLSGLLAARTLSGGKERIVGEDDFGFGLLRRASS